MPTPRTKPAKPGSVRGARNGNFITAKVSSKLAARARQATKPAKRYQITMNTKVEASASPAASLPRRIVSSPTIAPMVFCAIGAFFNAAGRLPAWRMPTRKSTSSCVNWPVIRPLSVIVLITRGADSRLPSSMIPSRE